MNKFKLSLYEKVAFLKSVVIVSIIIQLTALFGLYGNGEQLSQSETLILVGAHMLTTLWQLYVSFGEVSYYLMVYKKRIPFLIQWTNIWYMIFYTICILLDFLARAGFISHDKNIIFPHISDASLISKLVTAVMSVILSFWSYIFIRKVEEEYEEDNI